MARQNCSSKFYFPPSPLRGDHVTLAGCDIISPETAKTRSSSPKKQRGSFSATPNRPLPTRGTGPPTAVTAGAPVRLLGKMVSLFREGERCLLLALKLKIFSVLTQWWFIQCNSIHFSFIDEHSAIENSGKVEILLLPLTAYDSGRAWVVLGLFRFLKMYSDFRRWCAHFTKYSIPYIYIYNQWTPKSNEHIFSWYHSNTSYLTSSVSSRAVCF